MNATTDREFVLLKYPEARPMYSQRKNSCYIKNDVNGKMLSGWCRSTDAAWTKAAKRIRKAERAKNTIAPK